MVIPAFCLLGEVVRDMPDCAWIITKWRSPISWSLPRSTFSVPPDDAQLIVLDSLERAFNEILCTWNAESTHRGLLTISPRFSVLRTSCSPPGSVLVQKKNQYSHFYCGHKSKDPYTVLQGCYRDALKTDVQELCSHLLSEAKSIFCLLLPSFSFRESPLHLPSVPVVLGKWTPCLIQEIEWSRFKPMSTLYFPWPLW